MGVGKVLKRLRKQQKGEASSVRGLAALAGVSPSTVGYWENGQVRQGHRKTLDKFAAALGTTAEEILALAAAEMGDVVVPGKGVSVEVPAAAWEGFRDFALDRGLIPYRLLEAAMGLIQEIPDELLILILRGEREVVRAHFAGDAAGLAKRARSVGRRARVEPERKPPSPRA